MKGYIIVSEPGNSPLYICLSKEQAKKTLEKIDVPCCIVETPIIETNDQPKIIDNLGSLYKTVGVRPQKSLSR